MAQSDLRDQLQLTLSAAYTLERELGHGGMATVFLAQDLKHRRPVALKVLRPDLGAALGPQRFRREISVAASLQHPHILSVYDSGETPSGQLWFTMMYVDGESLRDRLEREHQLPLEEAVRITREAALALQYAHEHGVVHRDIKPENLLLTKDGSTLVADFGIARALTSAGAEAGKLTETGVAIGTPQYMSPEQASAERGLDARTDVYSLGAVCYEMLAGQPPFTGPTAQSIIAQMMSGEPPSVRRLRPTVPPAVDEVIRKALSPVPGDRFAASAGFATALTLALASATSVTTISIPSVVPGRWRRGARVAGFAALTVGIGAAAISAWHAHERSVPPALGTASIAVLPFDNLGDTSDAYFADGITDAVRAKLTGVPGLVVIAPASSAHYRATSKSSQQIGRELGVTYLLTGRVRWAKMPGAPGRVEVSPALIDASSAADKWEHPFDASVTDVFKVQAQIAGQVAHELGIVLGSNTEHRLDAVPTRNLAAYDAYLRGAAISSADLAIDIPTLRRAVAAYTEAVVLDSNFALAWARLSASYATIYDNSSPDPTDAEAARRAADRAMALDSTLPEAWLAEGMYNVEVMHNHARGLTDAEAGLRLAPSHSQLMFLAGFAEARLAQWDSAFARLRRTLELDPRSVNALGLLGDAYIRLRRFSEARVVLDRALSLAPTDVGTINERALLSLGEGDLAGARTILEAAPPMVDRPTLLAFFSSARSLSWVLDDAEQRYLLTFAPTAFGDRASWALTLAETYATRGDRLRSRAYADTARIAYQAILRGAPSDALSHAYLGEALAYLGRRDDAVREAERALALSPLSRDITVYPASQFYLARIHMLFGDRDAAINQLEALLRVPYYLSPAWLRIDPTFAELHGNPHFERLIAQSVAGAPPAS